MTSTRRALVWAFAERYSSLVISVISAMVLARLLTPAQVGVYSLCAAVTTVAGVLRDFGVSEYLIQERDLTRAKMRAAYGVALLIAWSIGALIFLSRWGVAGFYGEAGVAQVLAVLSLQFLLLPLCAPAFALMCRDMAFRQTFVIQFVSNASQVATSLTLAALGFGFMSLAWGTVANVAAQVVLLACLRPRESFVLPALAEVRTVLRFGSMFVTSRIIEIVSRNIHEPVIAKSFDFASVGLFSRAWGLNDLFHQSVSAAILRVIGPSFASEYRSGRSVAEPFAKATAIYTCVSWPFFGFVALMSNEIVAVMFGSQWLAAAPLASVLALSGIPSGLTTLIPQVMSATGRIKVRLQVSMWVSPFQIALVLAMSFVGLTAIAFALVCSQMLTMILYIRQFRAAFGVSPRDWLRACGGSAMVAIGDICALAVALQVCRAFQLHALPTLILTATVAVAAWLLLAQWLRHPAYAEISRAMLLARQRLKSA